MQSGWSEWSEQSDGWAGLGDQSGQVDGVFWVVVVVSLDDYHMHSENTGYTKFKQTNY